MYWRLLAVDLESHKEPICSIAGNGFQVRRFLRRLLYPRGVDVEVTAEYRRQRGEYGYAVLQKARKRLVTAFSIHRRPRVRPSTCPWYEPEQSTVQSATARPIIETQRLNSRVAEAVPRLCYFIIVRRPEIRRPEVTQRQLSGHDSCDASEKG